MSIYAHMQSAVDIVNDSPHPSNKIAATLVGDGVTISHTNHWPEPIAQTIGTKTKIGNSSGTVHAESICILTAPKTDNASLFVTDPPCPNCMKNIAEAGIAKLYIDHKGFDKDWSKRRGDSFETMSMRIAAKAGIDVHVVYRKEERFEVISQHPPGYKPAIENPAIITLIMSSCGLTAGSQNKQKDPAIKSQDDNIWKDLIQKATESKSAPFALALATNQNNETVSILTNRHPTIGYTSETVEEKEDKYSFILQPLNRLLMTAAREGLKLEQNHIYSSRTPTSRELVNFIAAGYLNIHIGDKTKARDEHGLKALEQLVKANILNVIPSEAEGSL